MTINLSTLPPPTIVEETDIDQLTADWLSDLHSDSPSIGFDLATQGDPLWALARVAALRELSIRQHINASYVGQLLSGAGPLALEGLGAMPDVPKLPVETTEEYSRALSRAPSAFGTGSRERYERGVILADARIESVYAATPNPTELDVEWLPVDGTNPADYTEIEANILLALEDVDDAGYQYRMLTDTVSVTQASISQQNVTAHLHLDRVTSASVAIAAAEAALATYEPQIKAVRAVIARSEIYDLLDVDGVLGVDLTTPASDVGPTAATAYEWGTITITAGLASWL